MFVDPRLYRVAFVPALLAVVAAMFSLVGPPDPLEPALAPAAFEGDRASATARQIVALAPERPPGSEGDAAIADLVAERFSEVRAGSVSEQSFEAEVDGDGVELRNVLLTLPGDVTNTVVVLAARQSAAGTGAASSAAATGVLVELASVLGVAGHEKTLVLASTSGGTAGATGASEVIAGLPESDTVDAVIVISQPGAAERGQPFVIVSSTASESGSIQLEGTAALAVETQVGEVPQRPSAFAELARLAIPSGIGAQAELIADGVDAVAISSAGERPLASDDDEVDDLSGETVDAFGRAIQSTVAAVDIAPGSLEHGPSTYLELGGNLVPGWSLAVLALALILPAGVAALDACARAARREEEVVRSLAWAAARALPLIGAVAALFALAVVGLVPRPEFPFDPGLHSLGARAVVTFILCIAVAGASAYLLRASGVTARTAPAAADPALGAISAAAALLLWLSNPYLALLAAPLAHVWLLAGRVVGPVTQAAIAAVAIVALVPLIAGLTSVSSALELGGDAPWTFVLMIADGQIGLATTLAACFLGGSVLGVLAIAIAARRGGGPALPAEG